MPFEINDALSFEENLAAFAKSLEADDLKLAAVLAQKLPELLNGPHPTVGCLGRSGNRVPGADTMSGWLLQSVEIEGLRGINNEGAPLLLRLKPDCVTSISAQNGVGKSSIFDAITFAIRGIIPKLDGLAASENGRSYYVNSLSFRWSRSGNPDPRSGRRRQCGSHTRRLRRQRHAHRVRSSQCRGVVARPRPRIRFAGQQDLSIVH